MKSAVCGRGGGVGSEMRVCWVGRLGLLDREDLRAGKGLT